MKKIRCIDNTYTEASLTTGKVYVVLNEFKITYNIMNDKGEEQLVAKLRFKEMKDPIEVTVNEYSYETTASIDGIDLGRIDDLTSVELLQLLQEKDFMKVTVNYENGAKMTNGKWE